MRPIITLLRQLHPESSAQSFLLLEIFISTSKNKNTFVQVSFLQHPLQPNEPEISEMLETTDTEISYSLYFIYGVSVSESPAFNPNARVSLSWKS